MRQQQITLHRVREFLTRVPFNRFLGLRLTRLHPDGITLECPLRGDLRNSAGAAHGGVAATIADAAVGIALQRRFGGMRSITTVELKVNYFRPITEGRLIARSHILRIGSTLCVGRVDLSDQRKRPAGTAIVTYIVLRARHSASEVRPRRAAE